MDNIKKMVFKVCGIMCNQPIGLVYLTFISYILTYSLGITHVGQAWSHNDLNLISYMMYRRLKIHPQTDVRPASKP